MAGETILHIDYDSVLMQVREAVLERHGYHVVSVMGNDAAKRIASDGANLVIVGNGGRLEERAEMVRWLASNWPHVPVLAMSVSEIERFPEAAVVFIGDTPNDLIAVAQRIIVSRKKRRGLGT
jgi:DNA-binding NtrC family response regulator